MLSFSNLEIVFHPGQAGNYANLTLPSPSLSGKGKDGPIRTRGLRNLCTCSKTIVHKSSRSTVMPMMDSSTILPK